MKITSIGKGKQERFSIEGLTAAELSSLKTICQDFIKAADSIARSVPGGSKNRKGHKTAVVLVDLGLPSGTLWADRNLGADRPEDYGDYYRWGETVPYTGESPEYEFRDQGEDIAGTEHDAAAAVLGKDYRMPDFDQIKELIDCCTSTPVEQNGVSGFRITGPNGNSIFIPAAGLRYSSSGTSIYNVSGTGYCWASSAYSTTHARLLGLHDSYCYWDSSNRAYGLTVRPVQGNYRH